MAYGTVKLREILALLSGSDQTIGDLDADIVAVDTIAVTANAPGDNTASVALIGQKDSSVASKATLDIETEEVVVVVGTFTPSHKMVIWLNGVEYQIQLQAVT